MSWLAPKLNKRIDICKPIQTPDSDGGFQLTFEVVVSIWANIMPAKTSPFARWVRGMQTVENVTHNMIIRSCALDVIKNKTTEKTLNPLKSNYFIFLREGNENASTKGRRFRIHEVVNVKEAHEYYIISAEELNEEGTSYDAI
jgi:head-tail adaptor